MLSNGSHFLTVLGGIGASLLWFIAGRQSLSNRKPDAAVGWQSVAVIIILIDCGWAIAWKEWLGSVLAIGVMCFEVWIIRRALNKRQEAGTL
jgi:hypothetical protein